MTFPIYELLGGLVKARAILKKRTGETPSDFAVLKWRSDGLPDYVVNAWLWELVSRGIVPQPEWFEREVGT